METQSKSSLLGPDGQPLSSEGTSPSFGGEKRTEEEQERYREIVETSKEDVALHKKHSNWQTHVDY